MGSSKKRRGWTHLLTRRCVLIPMNLHLEGDPRCGAVRRGPVEYVLRA